MSAPTVRNVSNWGLFQTPAQNQLPQPQGGSDNYIVGFIASTSQITGAITDTANNVYTIQNFIHDLNNNYITCFLAPVSNTGTGNLTVSSASGGSLFLCEVIGAASSNVVDGVANGTYNSSGPSAIFAGSITTSVATDLILSAVYDQNNALLAPNSGILMANAQGIGGDAALAQKHTVNTIGSYTESVNIPSSAGETAAIVAIAIKGTGSSTIPVVIKLYANGAIQANVFTANVALPTGVVFRLGANNVVQASGPITTNGGGKTKFQANGQLICNNTIIV